MPKGISLKIFVFSINIGFTFLGIYGESASEAVPFNIFLTDRYPINVNVNIIIIISG